MKDSGSINSAAVKEEEEILEKKRKKQKMQLLHSQICTSKIDDTSL
jgi:hypothetical protein